VGTGAGACTVVSVPEQPEAGDTLIQCLNSAVFDQGQIIFGGLAHFPEVGAVGRFGILGGTGEANRPLAIVQDITRNRNVAKRMATFHRIMWWNVDIPCFTGV
jgi:hypothetical protein